MKTSQPASILLVDDQEQMLTVMMRMLGKVGHAVTPCASGQDALDVIEDPDRTIDLLVTDILMPHMDGLELARRAREVRPDLPILFVSAYQEYQFDVVPFGEKLLEKPFSMRTLIDTVEARLEKARQECADVDED